ncbi:MAG: response regulator [Desulfitobacteriaceae bacterium]
MDEIDLLLVEDDPMVMAVNENFIQRVGGFRIVGEAQTGRKALELLQTLQPKLTILDIYLPDLSGVQILKEIRNGELPTDVIMITAAQDVGTVQEMLRFGAVDYIVKPFKYERLKAALEKYKGYVEKLSEGGALDQTALDSLMNVKLTRESRGGNRNDDLPKGLREITLQQILGFLARGRLGYSAEEVAEGVGLARVTARRYLEYLEKIGEVRLESRYGTVGRPINKYRVP